MHNLTFALFIFNFSKNNNIQTLKLIFSIMDNKKKYNEIKWKLQTFKLKIKDKYKYFNYNLNLKMTRKQNIKISKYK